MQYRIKNTLVPVPVSHEQPLLATLVMYDKGEDLTASPLIKSKINLTHKDVYLAEDKGVALQERQKTLIALYEDIKADGYNGSPILVWFDEDGFIHLYDGYHRLSIMKHLGIEAKVVCETEWSGIDGAVGKDFPLIETLMKEHPPGKWLYQPVADERLKGWKFARNDCPQRLEHIAGSIVGRKVLDIGCSEGYFSRGLARMGYDVTAIDHRHGFIAAARYLSVLEGLSISYHQVADWKEFVEQNGSYDTILFLSVIHNDMKQIGVEAGLKKMEVFRGKASRVLLETPQEKGEKEWMVSGYPQFNFFEEDSVKKVEEAVEMKAKEMWSLRPGTRPIYTFDSEEIPDNRLDEGKLVRTDTKSGFSMYLFKNEPILTPTILQTHEWEVDVIKFIQENLKEGQTFVDVGAYVGYYSILASKIVGDKGKVYAFEPSPDSYQVLLANIELNKCRNIIPMKVALSSRSGQAKLLTYGIARSNGLRGLSKVDEREPGWKEGMLSRLGLPGSYPLRESGWILVDTTRLDDVLTEPPDLIKVDVEGGERSVLEGATGILRNKDLKLIIEEVQHAETSNWLVNELGFTVITKSRGNCLLSAASVEKTPWWSLEQWIPDHRGQYWPLFNTLRYKPCRNIMEIGTHNGNNAVAMVKAAAQKVPEEEIHYYGFDLFEECTPELTAEEFSPALVQQPVALRIIGTNFGDLLNIPILTYYFGEGLEFLTIKEIKPKSKVLVGAGTLIGYTMPTEWYLDKDITFLGTGSRSAEEKVSIPAKGFTRGKLTEKKTGIKALGDVGILVDRVYGAPNVKRTRTGIVLDKTDREIQVDLPNPDRFTAQGLAVSQLLEVYNRIAGCQYIITDRLHVAVVAESLRIPWILWNHGDKTLRRTPRKFVDWAEMIGKERFVIEDIANLDVIKENTDFSASEKQKDILEAAIRGICQELTPRNIKTVDAKIRQYTKAKVSLFKGDTKKVLPGTVGSLPKMDLIYIDGGHSIETTRNDWGHAQRLMDKHTVVYFDDYNDEMPFIGSHFIVGELSSRYSAEVMPNTNYYKRPFGRLKCQLLKVTVRKPKATLKTEHFRFHLMSLPHSKTVKNWGPCAFTMLAYRFCQMMMDCGHEVYHYGTEGSNPTCTEQIDVLTEAVQKQAYGDWSPYKQLWIHNGKDLAYTTFRKNAITELSRRKEPGDILLISNGGWLREISDKAGQGIATVEPFVGYLGFYSKYKVFPSYAWMHHMYGKLSRQPNTENFVTGNWYDAVIPHFFDPDDYTFEEKKEDYFLYLGRLIQRKGIHIAVDLCKRIGAKLYVAGQPLYPDKLEESLKRVGVDGPNVEYLGVLDEPGMDKWRSKARALIAPSIYMEPFGLIVPEASFSGTPVITTDWGAFPETVKQSETGYRCRTMDDFIWAANNVDKISPAACREFAIANFSMKRIGKAYHEYFTKVHDLFGKGWYTEHPDRDNLDWLRRY